ncbi:DUF3078 domain-containing protein [Maribacter sp. PR1]|uniref:DUF3078 domain-containing protein n=1 Tax=Maribacter cobaltidurans TaxID=1178778 RepID=A0ABU7IZA9_9FLAO|nr:MULTISPECIES: DUF3078 domain-containing protein [Maribacter]MDC6390935.1 DUF3078 domain-containing protein [Maribacter sp. PR1]MEE1978327.1 DUF3078 domain-containing protein [Maribacter cobaltidurans]
MKSLISSRTFRLFYLLFFVSAISFAQDTIPSPIVPDTVVIDTTVIDTIVIRKTQEKIKHIPRGVNLMNPIISFKRTKPLKDKYDRFRVPSFWTKENTLGINLSEVAFVNWNAGGDNAISGLGFLKFVRNYKFRYFKWDNNIELRYGLNAQDGRKIRKTEDEIRLSSNVGYRRDTISNWYYSVQLNFNTQFSNGYKYPDRETPISRFMAPGYLFFGAGTSYISENQKFNLYLSPLTQKSTFVLDQELADKGAFGVDKAVLDANGNVVTPGENHRMELGILVTHKWEFNVAQNIDVNSRLNLYTDYLKSFGNVDVDWELNIKMRVNKYILTTLGTHLIYDDDILFDEVENDAGVITDPGIPKIQFKQVLGVGVAVDF